LTEERWRNIQELFDQVFDLPQHERVQILANCSDETLRAEVCQLLASFEEAGGFLETSLDALALRSPHDQRRFTSGDQLLGRFEILRLLGYGGMGEVYEAQDYIVGERVALKTLVPELHTDKNASKQLRDELKRARRITHPNVCRVHELFETQDKRGRTLMFFTMELLAGETLATRLSRDGRLAKDQAILILRQVAMGLEAAHKSGLLHRDLKPSNIFLSESANGLRVVITDFGLACRLSDGRDSITGATVVGFLGGTPGYMAPEQYKSGKLTSAADIYSLGIIAHELLYGLRPDNAYSLRRDASLKSWTTAIAKATASEPSHRYQTASQFVSACSPEWWMSRRMAIAGLVAAGGAVSGSLLMLSRPRRPLIRIAILPFNAARETDEHWADGLTDALIRVLRINPTLEITGRESVSRYKDSLVAYHDAGSDLNVDWLVGGTVGRIGNDLQIHVELVRSGGGSVFWSTTLRNRADMLASLTAEVARQIGDQLSVSLTEFGNHDLMRTNQSALEHYLRGRSLWNRRFADQLVKAKAEFEQSLQDDPNFSLAWCGLADVLSTLADYHFEPPATILPRAKQCALNALNLDSRLADCHISFAQATALNDWDWSTADASFRKAISIDRQHPLARQWYSILLMKMGRRDECLAQAEELTRIDPLSVSAYRNLCLTLYFTRHYQQSLDVARRVTDMSPEHFGMHELRGECYARLGDRVNAVRECTEALRQQQTPGLATTWAAVSFAILGMKREAEDLITKLSGPKTSIRFQPTNVARAWAELQQTDRAFQWLERASNERDTMLQILPIHESFDHLRSDPRYSPFLGKLRITYPPSGIG
jgi:eukaryotic-like serine/threonine-protein kinase